MAFSGSNEQYPQTQSEIQIVSDTKAYLDALIWSLFPATCLDIPRFVLRRQMKADHLPVNGEVNGPGAIVTTRIP